MWKLVSLHGNRLPYSLMESSPYGIKIPYHMELSRLSNGRFASIPTYAINACFVAVVSVFRPAGRHVGRRSPRDRTAVSRDPPFPPGIPLAVFGINMQIPNPYTC